MPASANNSQQLFPSASLLIVQSRLHSPAYAGPGKWIIVDMATRRSFLAIGKDRIPLAVALLERACGGAAIADLLDDSLDISEQHIDHFLQVGLLSTSKSAPTNLVDLYHSYTYNYPFEDYSSPTWRAEDQALMEEYARMWPPPELFSKYEGPFIDLEKFDFNDPELDLISLRDAELSTTLAFVLQFVFGQVGTVRSKFMSCLRKTSPSGGARHPTEAYIVLHEDLDQVSAGIYAYDAERHRLAWVKSVGQSRSLTKGPVDVIICSSVERAMWRYRDVRAYRPILLDIGHITEMVCQAGAAVGLDSQISAATGTNGAAHNWMHQPEFLRITLSPKETSRSGSMDESNTDSNDLNEPTGNDICRNITNPFLYVRPSPTGFVATVSWPYPDEASITATDFFVLDHCVPSLRGDRDTTTEGILSAGLNTTAERLQQLKTRHILIDESLASYGYNGARFWSKYGWYLSLLKYSEFRSSSRGQSASLLTSQRCDLVNTNSIRKIMARRTSRSFRQTRIGAAVVIELLTSSTIPSNISVIVAALAIDGLEQGLYKWTEGAGLHSMNCSISREQIAAATIGQQPSSSGAFTLWLLGDLSDLNSNIEYEFVTIAIGMAAHRVCLAATLRGLGVFMTPALSEEETLAFMQFNGSSRCVMPYLLCIGEPSE